MICWVMLVVAIVFEALGATFMELSAGFTRPLPLLLMLGSYAVGWSLLVYVLRMLELSVVHALWSGQGTARCLGRHDLVWRSDYASQIDLAWADRRGCRWRIARRNTAARLRSTANSM